MKSLADIKLLISSYGWVFTRKSGVIFVQLRDETMPRKQGRFISTGTTDATEAYFIIREWVHYGFPEKKPKQCKEVFWVFCKNYWCGKYETLECTKIYSKGNVNWVENQVKDFFKNKLVSQITPSLVQDFFEYCKSTETNRYKEAKEKGVEYTKNRFLSPSSIRILRNVICIPLQYASRKKINNNSLDWVQSCRFKKVKNKQDSYFSGMVRPRDIFSTDELNRIQNYDWGNPIAKMVFVLARATGMRLGELRGLKIGCVHSDRIIIDSAYNDVDLYKGTKTGQVRMYPISKALYNSIQEYIKALPLKEWQTPDSWLFPSTDPNKPICETLAPRYLERVMKKLNIPKERQIMGKTFIRTFHSLRHCKDMELVKANLSIKEISDLIGHHESMVKRYTNHYTEDTFNDIKIKLQDAGLL